VAWRKSGGIYHEKIGIFSDNYDHHVSFSGSVNETWMGWSKSGNYESFEVFCSWKSGDGTRTIDHLQFFEDMWNGRSQSIDVIDFPSVETSKLSRLGSDDLGEFFAEYCDTVNLTVATSNGKTLMTHQVSALESWERSSRKGILEHATGSGKTITAIEAIRRHLCTGQPAIVFVPSKLLLFQWLKEIKSEIPTANILVAGGGATEWKKHFRLHAHTSANTNRNCVVIATMQTASSETFLQRVSGGKHLLVVLDEIHQVGSTKNSNILDIEFGSCLGLSATPTRYGDEVGTRKILDTYGPVLQPKVTLSDAIESGRLVPYEYYPTPVTLNERETKSWKKLTKQISVEYAKISDPKTPSCNSDLLKKLQIQRSAISKNAECKLDAVRSVFSQHYRNDQRWLVYCENSTQLGNVRDVLRSMGLDPLEYHSQMAGDRVQTLSWFETINSILLSIRCLDEGVDIPSVSHALILSSSQNPRQFIQRRGRVLRSASNKKMAYIFDIVVLPPYPDDDLTTLVATELRRAYEFANSCINVEAITKMVRIGIDFGVDFEGAVMDDYEEE
jgi:superfamily II DNA or RNA helicase